MLKFPISKKTGVFNIMSGIALFFSSILPLSANVGISTYRIYLDSDHSFENFLVSNRLNQAQECDLRLTHYKFDELGNMSSYEDGEAPLYPADDLFRFSPRHFNIPANQEQTVRFTLRRKSNTPDVEHRSFVVVSCQKTVLDIPNTNSDSNSNLVSIALSPLLEHNIPLQVRPKKIAAVVEFKNIRMQDTKLNFDMQRSGDRSIIGTIEIYDKDSGELITNSNPLVMYIETITKSFTMDLKKSYDINNLIIKFVEDKRYGGTIVKSWPE
jgi:P pilus assembly chaperone PapD